MSNDLASTETANNNNTD